MRTDIDSMARQWSDTLLARHEAKYIIPPSLVPEIREFIRPFVHPDPNAHGTPPEYAVTTLLLDSPDLSLHRARVENSARRYNLRIRTYGEDGTSRVFLEIKRKVHGLVYKRRLSVAPECWGERLICGRMPDIHFTSESEKQAYLEFVGLVRAIGAEPVMLIRYTREAYLSRIDLDCRVSLDRQLLYQPAQSWDMWEHGGKWRSMESCLARNRECRFSGVILELKSPRGVPQWIIDLTRQFDLVRTGNSKYCTTVWMEALFRHTCKIPSSLREVLGLVEGWKYE